MDYIFKASLNHSLSLNAFCDADWISNVIIDALLQEQPLFLVII